MVFVHFPPSSGRGRKGQIEGGPRSHPVCPSVPVSLLVHEPTRGASPSSSGGLPQQAQTSFLGFCSHSTTSICGKMEHLSSEAKTNRSGFLPPSLRRAGGASSSSSSSPPPSIWAFCAIAYIGERGRGRRRGIFKQKRRKWEGKETES